LDLVGECGLKNAMKGVDTKGEEGWKGKSSPASESKLPSSKNKESVRKKERP